MTLQETFAKQLDALLAEHAALAERSEHKDLSDQPKHLRQALISKAIAAVRRISGPNSSYSAEIERLLGLHRYLHEHHTSIIGVVQGLRDDVSAGVLSTVVELIHGEVFSDFLEMADHLEQAKYKDAAAVIAGSTLESHLRALCSKNRIPTESPGTGGKLVAKKADLLNAELCKADVYSKLDQKAVTAWLDLRNSAAHGHYDQYDSAQVRNMIDGVRGFLTRIPA